MIIKDEFGRKHVVNNNYDNKDFIVTTPNKTFQEMTPNDIISRTAYNYNQLSTKVDEVRSVTLVNLKPAYRQTGEPINSRKRYNW